MGIDFEMCSLNVKNANPLMLIQMKEHISLVLKEVKVSWH